MFLDDKNEVGERRYTARIACAAAYCGTFIFTGYWIDGLDRHNYKWRARKATVIALLEREAAQTVCLSMAWGVGG